MQLLIILLVVAIICILWILAVRGRRNAPGIEKLDGWYYAHRGLHSKPDAPENSLEAFKRAVAKGYGSEMDVHLLADGRLGIMHDSNMKRVTGVDKIIETLREDELKNYHLGESRETIPTLREVLDVYKGKAPLIIELKPYENNYAPLCEAVCRELEGYEGVYCIESFFPQVVLWLKKNRPDIIRGQLSMDYLKSRGTTSFLQAVVSTNLFWNFLSRPDFVAYRFRERNNISNKICMKLWKMRGASWTLKTKADFEEAKKEHLWPIFEKIAPEYDHPTFLQKEVHPEGQDQRSLRL